MPPKDKKKKAVKKPPPFQMAAADLEPFGVQVGQLVRNALGCTGTVLGVKAAAGEPPRLWVRYANGLEAPIESRPPDAPPLAAAGPTTAGAGAEEQAGAAGFRPCSAAEQLRRDMADRQREQQALDAKWQVYNAEQARKAAEAAKAAAKKKKKAAPAAEQPGEAGQPQQRPPTGTTSVQSEAQQAGAL